MKLPEYVVLLCHIKHNVSSLTHTKNSRFLVIPTRNRNLDSVILMSPFQLEIFVILSASLSAGILPKFFSSDGLQETIRVAV